MAASGQLWGREVSKAKGNRVPVTRQAVSRAISLTWGEGGTYLGIYYRTLSVCESEATHKHQTETAFALPC